MIELDEIGQLSREEELEAIKNTNKMFLKLLYNLSSYPHTQTAKRFVRMGLIEFESSIFADRQCKHKKSASEKKKIKK